MNIEKMVLFPEWMPSLSVLKNCLQMTDHEATQDF
ncbi:rCG56765, partial [Rattus norvegicus]